MREIDELVVPSEANPFMDEAFPAGGPSDSASKAFDASFQPPISAQSSSAANAINTFRDSALGSPPTTFPIQPRQAADPLDEGQDPTYSDDESLTSCTSYAEPFAENQGAVVAPIPDPPKDFFESKPFKCPYCHVLLRNVSSHEAWKYGSVIR